MITRVLCIMVVDLSLPGSGFRNEGAASGFGESETGVQLKGSRQESWG